jgi:hypothetical protein
VYPPEDGSYPVAVFAFVQDAVTGQNVTTGGGQSYIAGGCGIQPTGFTECVAGGSVPPGHTYKITVYVTKTYLPCSIRPANHADLHCESQLLAPVSPTITVTEPSISTSTTVTSSTSSVSSPACGGGPTNTLLNPAPKGTVYVKVVTDQGTVITNGTLFVNQFGDLNNGERILRNLYCISLGDVNGTGYLQLAVLNGTGASQVAGNFLSSGYYNVTLMAGYNQGPGYVATIPSIQVHPNSTIYVTVSVPSGVVTVVTSNEGSSAVTTTTTSATTTKQNGG